MKGVAMRKPSNGLRNKYTNCYLSSIMKIIIKVYFIENDCQRVKFLFYRPLEVLFMHCKLRVSSVIIKRIIND